MIDPPIAGSAIPKAYSDPELPSAPRKRRPWLVAGVVLASAIVVVGLVAGVVTIAQTLGTQIANVLNPSGAQEPLVTGEPGSPLAVEPTACGENCFGFFAPDAATPSKLEFDEMGLTVDYDFAPPSSVRTEHTISARDWDVSGGTPEACFVTQPLSPITTRIDEEPEPDREIISFDGTHTDPFESTVFNQSVRLFADSDAAVNYMITIDDELNACTQYQARFNDEPWLVDVTRAPAISVPDSVAAVGWVESSATARYYVFDVQRGNYVVRTMVFSRSGMSEAEFRAVVESIALRVADIRLEK